MASRQLPSQVFRRVSLEPCHPDKRTIKSDSARLMVQKPERQHMSFYPSKRATRLNGLAAERPMPSSNSCQVRLRIRLTTPKNGCKASREKRFPRQTDVAIHAASSFRWPGVAIEAAACAAGVIDFDALIEPPILSPRLACKTHQAVRSNSALGP